jgi:CubicO group peptidase (beta-lactamase class C family)
LKGWRRSSIWASGGLAAVLALLASGDAPLPSAGAAPNTDATAEASAAEPRPFDFGEIDDLVEQALREGKTPGAVVVVGRHDRILFQRAYGERAVLPVHREMTLDTIFDLASLTKPLVTGTLAAWLIQRGELRLSDTVSKYLPEFTGQGKETITVEELLLHTSGLPPSNPLHDYRQGRQRARARAIGSVLEAYPGRKFIYSDVGYIVLGMLIERVTGESLDTTARRVVWAPLGMADTQYCRTLCDSLRIAPTELASGRHASPIRGEVQDPRAYLLGGVAGNAGVFSTGEDLSRFARMLLGQGELDGVRILSAEAVREFTEPRPVPGGGVRSLGWDVSSHYSRARGAALSEQAYGHGGYTGTSLWIDPTQDLFVIMLSNRNHPFGKGNVLALQGTIADAAVHALQRAGEPNTAPSSASASPAAALGRLQLPSELPSPSGPAVDSLGNELRHGGG